MFQAREQEIIHLRDVGHKMVAEQPEKKGEVHRAQKRLQTLEQEVSYLASNLNNDIS